MLKPYRCSLRCRNIGRAGCFCSLLLICLLVEDFSFFAGLSDADNTLSFEEDKDER